MHDEFVHRILQRMRANHMLRIDIARKSGIPKNTISQYMTGKRKPTYDKVVRIAQALNCKPGDLLDMDEDLE